jgi:hypothetical protein
MPKAKPMMVIMQASSAYCPQRHIFFILTIFKKFQPTEDEDEDDGRICLRLCLIN